MLTQHERDFFICQIECGYIEKRGIKIYWPDKYIRYQAEQIYRDALNNDLLSEAEIMRILYSYGIWTDEMELDYREIPKEMEDLKVDLYKNFFSNSSKLRYEIRKREERMENILQIRHIWDHYTKEGYANYCRTQFIIDKTVDSPDNKARYFSFFLKEQPTDSQIRELSRTDPWVTLYDMGYTFKNTDVEKRLFVYTKMYNSIREHQDCPPDEIIEDDYALDGWIILQKRMREKEKNISHIEKKLGKNINAQEVFIPVSSIEEAKKIDQLNTDMARATKKMRFDAIDKQKDLQEVYKDRLYEKL